MTTGRKTTRRKAKRPGIVKPPRRNSLTAARHSGTSAGSLKTKNARLTRALREAQEQQTATSEVLKVISRSEFELQPVLESLVQNAVRLCGADRGFIFRQDGEVYRVAASYGHSPEFLEVAKRYPIHNDRTSATGRAVRERRVVHIPDILADTEYRWAEDHRGEEEMHRTILAVPMLRDGTIIGVLVIRRIRVQPFTEKQIGLLTTFADQAVIAIENVRLFEAEQARARELSEALEQQTATSEVLGVISSSPGELEPVFQAMLANATRICEANFGILYRYDGNVFHAVAFQDVAPAFADHLRRQPPRPGSGNALGRLLETKQPVHIADVKAEPAFLPVRAAAFELGGARTYLIVPMLKDEGLIGAISIYRQKVRPFTDKQIALVTNFASQAVIAIENARLLSELRESLEQQTASSEVLGMISSSPGDLQPVFQTILANATRICEANFGFLYRYDGHLFHAEAMQDVRRALLSPRSPELARFSRCRC